MPVVLTAETDSMAEVYRPGGRPDRPHSDAASEARRCVRIRPERARVLTDAWWITERGGEMPQTSLPQTSLPAEAPAGAPDEVDAVRTLHELNAEYIRAFVKSDAAWYAEHLADDFVCTRADGRRIGKEEFLRLAAEGPGVTDVSYDEIDVRP